MTNVYWGSESDVPEGYVQVVECNIDGEDRVIHLITQEEAERIFPGATGSIRIHYSETTLENHHDE